MMMDAGWGSRAAGVALWLWLVLGAAAGVRAQQGSDPTVDRCSAASGSRAFCLEAVATHRGAAATIMTGLAGAGPVAGTASTLGHRVPGTPRVAMTAGLLAAPVALPGLGSAVPDGVTPLPEVSGTLFGFRLASATGLFHGAATGPTVGGIGAVDLLAGLTWLAPPTSAGFGGSVLGYGVGARIGLLRESFTLPGISLSVVRHGSGRTEILGAGGARLSFRTEGWSLRGAIGKDVSGIGTQVGFGSNRVSGPLVLEGRTPAGATERFLDQRVPSQRGDVLFLGATYTWLVFQTSGEVGWMKGPEAPAGRPPGSYDPSVGRFFGTLQGRVTF